MAGGAGAMHWFYRTFGKRTSTYFFAMVGGVFVFERVFDPFADYLFERVNQGKLYKHLKVTAPAAEEEE